MIKLPTAKFPIISFLDLFTNDLKKFFEGIFTQNWRQERNITEIEGSLFLMEHHPSQTSWTMR